MEQSQPDSSSPHEDNHSPEPLKLHDILADCDESTLESLAADKVDDVIHLRLPHEVLIEEIAGTIASFSYVSEAISRRHPPSFEILDLLLTAGGYQLEVSELRRAVTRRIAEVEAAADGQQSFSIRKEHDLYLRMLEAAWVNDLEVDTSESSMLTALRRELDISFREHILLEHSSRVRSYWKTGDAYERERNHLLRSGILYTVAGRYVLPEELPPLIRAVWAMELPEADFRRLLGHLNNDRLYSLLQLHDLKVAGTKDEKIDRLLANYVEPRSVLQELSLADLREFAREVNVRVSGSKDELIDRLVEVFLEGADVIEPEDSEPEPIEPEQKDLARADFEWLFSHLTIEHIYDVASKLDGIQRSGSKHERIGALWESPYSEHSLLEALNSSVLSKTLRGMNLAVSGPKDEKIARLVDWAGDHGSRSASGDDEVFQHGALGEDKLEELPTRRSEHEPELPRDFEAIRSRFDFLTREQQIVLSALKELRSLNENELTRLVARYDLDWFLIKAEMLDLVEQLETNGHAVVQIRAVGDHNMYEFAGD